MRICEASAPYNDNLKGDAGPLIRILASGSCGSASACAFRKVPAGLEGSIGLWDRIHAPV